MKRSRLITVLVLSVMLLGVIQPAFAWGTRTGSRTGDALVYGASGGILATIGVGALLIFCPPAGVAAGTALAVGGGAGAVGGVAYGALWENKTLKSDIIAGGGVAVAAPALVGGAAYVAGAKGVETVGKVVVGGGAACFVGGVLNKAGEACAEEMSSK